VTVGRTLHAATSSFDDARFSSRNEDARIGASSRRVGPGKV